MVAQKKKLEASEIFDFKTIIVCWDEVQDFFQDKEKSLAWFCTDNPNLGGCAPFTMMLKGREKKLLKVIKNLKDGEGP